MEKRIEAEKIKLTGLFKELDEKKRKLAEKLIDNAAYMSIQLEELNKYIVQNGVKEVYQNGENQCGYKESVESKTYNAMIKNYLATIKQLNDMLPASSEKVKVDDFENF